MNQPTISLCMIVRDAEHTLGDALDSARPFVDELVVVDTGSVDNTVKVAKARNARIYHYPWTDSFSAARNESIEKATCDWIFWMDADDILVQSTGGELRRSIAENPNHDAGFVIRMEEQLQDAQGHSKLKHWAQCKLFPRHPEIRFQYRMHEKISPSIQKLGYKIKMCNAIVQHANVDRSPEANSRRNKRNQRLLELDLKENPDNGIVLFNVGSHYLYQANGSQKAIELLERSLGLLPKYDSIRLCVYQDVINAYWRTNDYGRIAATCESALDTFPDVAIFLFYLGRVNEIQGNDRTAEEHYLRALNHGQVVMTSVNDDDLNTKIAMNLGLIYMRTNREQEMESFWLKFLGKHPHDWKLRGELIKAYISNQRPDEAEKQLQLFPTNPETMVIRLSLAGCIAVLRKDWVNAIYYLTESRRMGMVDPFSLHGLSVAFMAVGRITEAETVLEQLLEIAPDHPHAVKNLEFVHKHLGRTQQDG